MAAGNCLVVNILQKKKNSVQKNKSHTGLEQVEDE